MKKVILLLSLMFFIITDGESQVLKRLGDRAKRKLENKAGDKVDKSIDESLDGKKKDAKSKSKDNGKDADADSESASADQESEEETSTADAGPVSLKVYSKYDFVPGQKVIAYEDFNNAEIGDFPTRWNTNASGEMVTVSNKEGKWLKVSKEGVFHPEFITELPENFTFEFDLGVNNDWNSSAFVLNIANLKTPEDFTDYAHYVRWQGDHAIHLQFRPALKNITSGNSKILAGKDGNHSISNDVSFTGWNNTDKLFGHISIWRQKQRLRVYLNGEKIWDLPKAFDATAKYNAITYAVYGSHKLEDYFLINNLRLAVGAPDTRNKLITEGKFVTNGILFDVNSDVIKPESYGTLKDIANVLKENADVNVRIIGHTDSDGDEKKNADLSKRRAESVKKSLMSEFAIDQKRMETDGKGEAQPVDKNDNPVGKANNRRVEFVKL